MGHDWHSHSDHFCRRGPTKSQQSAHLPEGEGIHPGLAKVWKGREGKDTLQQSLCRWAHRRVAIVGFSPGRVLVVPTEHVVGKLRESSTSMVLFWEIDLDSLCCWMRWFLSSLCFCAAVSAQQERPRSVHGKQTGRPNTIKEAAVRGKIKDATNCRRACMTSSSFGHEHNQCFLFAAPN